MNSKYTRREFGIIAAGLGTAGGVTGALTSSAEAAPSAEYYVAPNGDDSNEGSKASPLASPRPLTNDGSMTVEDGSTIYFRGDGEIAYDQGNWFYGQNDLSLTAYEDEAPVLRATNPDKSDTFGPGLLQFGQCSGITVRGLEVYNSPAGGIKFENANDCTVEQCNTHHCDFSGIYIAGGSNFVARYNESWGNFGPERGEPGSVPGGDSDGIGISDGDGGPVNGLLIEYNRLHHNSDDGFDGIGGKNGVIRNNWVWANGYDADGRNVETSRGTGIKMGYPDKGSVGPWECYGNKVWYNGSVAFQYNWDQQPAHIYNNTGFANCRKHESIGYVNEDDILQNPNAGQDTTVVGNVGRAGTPGPGPTEVNSWQEFSNYFDAEWFESVAVDEKGNPTDPARFLRPTENSPLRDRMSLYRESDSTTIGSTMTMPSVGGEDPETEPEPEPEPEMPSEVSYDGQTFTFDRSLDAIDTVGLGPGYYNVTENLQWATNAHDGDLLVWLTESGTYDFRGQVSVGGDRTVALVVSPAVDNEVRFERADGSDEAAILFDCSVAIVDGVSSTGAIEFADGLQRANLDVDDGVQIYGRAETYDQTIVIDGSEGETDYGLRIGPNEETIVGIEKSTARNASINASDTIDRETNNGSVVVSGFVSGGRDAYNYTGEVLDFELMNTSGTVRVWIDGQEVDPASLGEPTENTITFDGRNGRGPYELTVSEGIIKSKANGASINSNDTISGSTAIGQVNGGQDSYVFDGDIESISADPSITVRLNGSEVEIGQRVEVVRASGSSNGVNYIIESTGTFETLDGGDESAGSKAAGTVTEETDTYRLRSGEITDVSTFGGNVVVTVDGSEWQG